MPNRRSSPRMPAIRYATPIRVATVGTYQRWRWALVSFIDIECLLDGCLEVPGQRHGQRQRWQVASGLDRVDGLPRDAHRGGEGGLRDVRLRAQGPHGVLHVSSMLDTFRDVKLA